MPCAYVLLQRGDLGPRIPCPKVDQSTCIPHHTLTRYGPSQQVLRRRPTFGRGPTTGGERDRHRKTMLVLAPEAPRASDPRGWVITLVPVMADQDAAGGERT